MFHAPSWPRTFKQNDCTDISDASYQATPQITNFPSFIGSNALVAVFDNTDAFFEISH